MLSGDIRERAYRSLTDILTFLRQFFLGISVIPKKWVDLHGLIRYSGYIVGAVSYVMIVVLLVFLLPSLLHMGA